MVTAIIFGNERDAVLVDAVFHAAKTERRMQRLACR